MGTWFSLALSVLGLAQPTLTWQGAWRPTDLLGAYHSYAALDDGTVACFQNYGVRVTGESRPSSALGVSFQVEPGDWLRWGPTHALMTWGAIDDLYEPGSTTTLAPDRLMTRPTVVRLADGSWFGLGVICRGYFPRDGLRWISSFTGPQGSIEALRRGETIEPWRYEGTITGSLGDWLQHAQRPYDSHTDLGSILVMPDGLLVITPNYLGRMDGQPSVGWTVRAQSRNGRVWDITPDDLADQAGLPLNTTPFHAGAHRSFPSTVRDAQGNGWMWQSDGWHGEPEGDLPAACREIFLYHSDDEGRSWTPVRSDVHCRQFTRPDGTIPALKNLSAWVDPATGLIHGMVAVWDEQARAWRKWHNTATVE